jgi:hypothetical protein
MKGTGMHPDFLSVRVDLTRALEQQNLCTAGWHENDSLIAEQADPEDLQSCIIVEHGCNFRLWHIEDAARRRDVEPEIVAGCKRKIDAMNQKRNDGMEMIDACLMRRLHPLLPSLLPGTTPRYNTESLGMAIDRLSILSLKIWHMDEQLARTDVDAAHIRACVDKAAVLRGQRRDLEQSVLELLDDFMAGRKQPRLYFQFKMYNDPRLNPQLYGAP